MQVLHYSTFTWSKQLPGSVSFSQIMFTFSTRMIHTCCVSRDNLQMGGINRAIMDEMCSACGDMALLEIKAALWQSFLD